MWITTTKNTKARRREEDSKSFCKGWIGARALVPRGQAHFRRTMFLNACNQVPDECRVIPCDHSDVPPGFFLLALISFHPSSRRLISFSNPRSFGA